MTELSFSFTDCTPVPHEPQLVIPAVVPEDQTVISVRDTGKTFYTYIEKASRCLTGWITVIAVRMIRSMIARVHAIVRSILPLSGVQILRKSAILNI